MCKMWRSFLLDVHTETTFFVTLPKVSFEKIKIFVEISSLYQVNLTQMRQNRFGGYSDGQNSGGCSGAAIPVPFGRENLSKD